MSLTINADTLRNSFLFKDVDQSVIQQVVQHCQPMQLRAGETLFEQDSVPDALYFLETGQIHIVRHYPEGHEVIIATEVPYYVIGELSLLANQPRTGSVVAIGDCELIRLSGQAIFELCKITPQIPLQALTHLGNRLYRLNLQVRESALGNIAARIATVLILLADNKTGVITASISASQLARATAVYAEEVERVLRQWAKNQIITRQGQQITINKLDAMRHLAG